MQKHIATKDQFNELIEQMQALSKSLSLMKDYSQKLAKLNILYRKSQSQNPDFLKLQEIQKCQDISRLNFSQTEELKQGVLRRVTVLYHLASFLYGGDPFAIIIDRKDNTSFIFNKDSTTQEMIDLYVELTGIQESDIPTTNMSWVQQLIVFLKTIASYCKQHLDGTEASERKSFAHIHKISKPDLYGPSLNIER